MATLFDNTDKTHNSNRAWSLIRKLSNDPRKADQHVNVTPNQVAHQLILNGKVPNRQRQNKIKRCGQENHDFADDFTIIELQNSLKHLKNGKTAGLDNILTEEIKNFGPVTMMSVLNLLNAYARTHRLPRLCRQARVVALLKPRKDQSSPKSFRPIISLLCHLYKLYERLILNHLSPIIEYVLIPEQAGFRPGKSCTAHVLNLTQHIEDGFETGKITGIVIVYLLAAYDTVNHRRLLEKVYNMTRDYRLMCMIRTLLENHRFFVELGGKRNILRSQRNGLPQGSVLAPLLFNVYSNDQHIHPGTRSFVYADDFAVATQSTDFAPIEETLTPALGGLTECYTINQLRANPTKTQVSLFHLRNRECGKQLNISWNDVNLTHCNLPVYLGLTLDRTLSSKTYSEKKKETRSKKQHHPQTKKLEMGSHSNHTQVVRSSAMLLSCRVCLPGVGTLHPRKGTERDTERNLSNGHRLSEANKHQQSARTRRNRGTRRYESGGKSYGADTANYGPKPPTQWTSRSGATPEIAEEFY